MSVIAISPLVGLKDDSGNQITMASELYANLGAIIIVIVLCVLCVGFFSKSEWCRCTKGSESTLINIDEKETATTLPSVNLRRESGAVGRRANTWPWKDARPPRSHARNKDDRDSNVIFSSNSLCLQIVGDEDEQRCFPLIGQLQVHDEGERYAHSTDEISSTGMQSVVTDFGEDIFRSLGALELEQGFSDSLRNIAGSMRSILAVGTVTDDGENGEDETEDEREEGIGEAIPDIDIDLIISDEEDEEFEALKDLVAADARADVVPADVSAAPPNIPGSSLLRYRYSLAREEILCRSSNTSSLALESPWLSGIGGEDFNLIFPSPASSLLQETCGSSLQPYLLYRYSISLEEIKFPSRAVAGVPAVLPLQPSTADDEGSEVFYDARSTVGSTRSSLVDQAGSAFCLSEDDPLLTRCLKSGSPRSILFSSPPDESAYALRRCSSLYEM